MMASYLIVRGKCTAIEIIISDLKLVPFDVDVSLCPLKVNQSHLPLLVEHKMFWLDIPIQVPALMDEL